MQWMLVVFLTSPIGEPPPSVIFQTSVASKELCEAAGAEIKRTLAGTDVTDLAKISTACLQVSN
jgi:hypothetical protein